MDAIKPEYTWMSEVAGFIPVSQPDQAAAFTFAQQCLLGLDLINHNWLKKQS